MTTRKEINEVFTPRSSKVNVDMYIPRDQLEKSLYRSVCGTMHTFLFGESGNGKSWLYKKVFAEKEINYVVANCANASRKESIVDEIYSVCLNVNSCVKTEYTESKKAAVSMVAKAELAHSDKFEILQEDKLIQAFKALSLKQETQKSVIVLDNLETIINSDKLLGELSDIIILLDDERYAKFNIKFLIVGLPNQVIEYFSTSKNTTSVANRVEETYRVQGLDASQVRELVRHGFERQLNVTISKGQLKILYRHINNITLGVPQRIHEYCEGLSYLLEDNKWEYDASLLNNADFEWLRKGLRECYSIVDVFLNSDETSNGRRNQVIYALGQSSLHEVNTRKIGKCIKEEFPMTAPKSNSGIGQVLSNLAKGKNPILRKVSKSDAYTFSDPRYLMCIRLMLHKDEENEQVIKKGFKFN